MRSKRVLLGAVILFSAALLWAATQPWVTLELHDGAAAVTQLSFSGQEMQPALSPLAVAAMVAALALTIAGRVFRYALAALILLLGAAACWITLAIGSDPRAAAAGNMDAHTGLAGSSNLSLIAEHQLLPTLWISAAVAAGVALCGAALLISVGTWAQAGKKYGAVTESSRARASVAPEEPDRISDWEALNDGVDPSEHTPKEIRSGGDESDRL